MVTVHTATARGRIEKIKVQGFKGVFRLHFWFLVLEPCQKRNLNFKGSGSGTLFSLLACISLTKTRRLPRSMGNPSMFATLNLEKLQNVDRTFLRTLMQNVQFSLTNIFLFDVYIDRRFRGQH